MSALFVTVLCASAIATPSTTPTRHTLSVSVTGGGKVTSIPHGISCPPTCHASFVSGSRVRLSTRAKAGWKFANWLRGCKGAGGCSVKLSTAKSVRAVFSKLPPPPLPANVVLQKSGFSFTTDSGITDLGYGLVLQNTSPDEDALNVAITVNVVDASNVIIESDSNTIQAIPASSTYYFGDEMFPNGPATPAGLQVVIQTGSQALKSLALPPVANVRLTDYILGGTEIDGEFSNPFQKPISGVARITGVIFDSAGNVIGGGFTFPNADVPPGSRIGFSIGVSSVQPVRAASAQVSVEPELVG